MNDMNEMNNLYNQNNGMYYNNVNNQIQKTKKSNILLIILYVLLGSCIISCFLPFVTGIFNLSMNYVYYANQVKDGVIVIAFAVLSDIFLIFKKKIPITICQVLSMAVIIYDFIDINGTDAMTSGLVNFGIGFYLVAISTVGAIVVSIIRIIKKENFN